MEAGLTGQISKHMATPFEGLLNPSEEATLFSPSEDITANDKAIK